jgi:hypothetical protein
LSEDLQNLYEELYDVDVENGCSEDVVIEFHLCFPAAQDELGVDV